MTTLNDAIARIASTAVAANKKQSTFRGCLYGPSGVGKSVIGAMIMRTIVPPDKVIIYIDTSEGYVSWRNHPGLSDGIIVIPFTTIEDLRHIASAIKNKIPPFDNVGGMILDESSKMTEIDVLRIFELRKAGIWGEKEKGEAEKEATVVGRDYQIALDRFRQVNYEIYDNRDLHVLQIAHQADKKDRQGAVVSVYPDFSPKIAKNMKEPLHLVANITATIEPNPTNPGAPNYRRVAQVHPSRMVDAKCRLGINSTSVSADELPAIIGKWVKEGREAVHADDTPRDEIITGPETTEPKTPQEVMTEVDNQDNSDLGSINLLTPIN